MARFQIGPAALLIAVIAGALALMLLPGPLTWLISIGGLTLLLTLLAYDQEGNRTFFQSLAFSAVAGFCIVLISVIIFQLAAGITTADKRFSEQWAPILWACATGIVCGIDRTRMGTRELSAGTRMHAPIPSHSTVFETAATSEYVPPPAPSATVSEPDQRRETPVQRPPMEPARPQPTPVPMKPGKETMIYVNLVGEGLNVLRSVRAEHLGRDFYKIIDSMPEGETWEFQAGQVVRCKKKNLSSGKGLVAVEEAPRA